VRFLMPRLFGLGQFDRARYAGDGRYLNSPLPRQERAGLLSPEISARRSHWCRREHVARQGSALALARRISRSARRGSRGWRVSTGMGEGSAFPVSSIMFLTARPARLHPGHGG